jgi:hypothetical protein
MLTVAEVYLRTMCELIRDGHMSEATIMWDNLRAALSQSSPE